MAEAIRIADFVVSATGVKEVVTAKHMAMAKEGVVLANAGHFDNEIPRTMLEHISTSHRQVREFVEEFVLRDGRRIYLLGEGRLVNLVAGQGHPVEIMDMSFSVQALALRHLVQKGGDLAPGVYPVPREVDEEVARLRLRTWGIAIDELTPAQRAYREEWREGT